MLPLRLQKLILGLSGRNRCETGQADGVKGTILVWPVRKIGDELISHLSASSLGRAFNVPQLTPERWSISLSSPRKSDALPVSYSITLAGCAILLQPSPKPRHSDPERAGRV
jgi:hypothetical protein